MTTTDSRVRCIRGRWFYVHPAYTVSDGMTGAGMTERVIERVPEELEAAESYKDAVARADWYDEQDRSRRSPGASEAYPMETVFDGDW